MDALMFERQGELLLGTAEPELEWLAGWLALAHFALMSDSNHHRLPRAPPFFHDSVTMK